MENRRMLQRVLEQVDQVILGKERENREILLAFLAGGNVLLEDIPGVGKTTLALAFSRAMGLEHRRVQFTPDVLPSDLTGFSIYRRETETFVYQPGSVFCNLLLADELNRTSPKTQSALLEVMEEGQVTVEGVTRAVPKPFLVIATQNPAGTAGTQPLPEAQVDRFLISLSLGYPDPQSELSLALSPMGKERLAQVVPVMEGKELLALQREVGGVVYEGQRGGIPYRACSGHAGTPYDRAGLQPSRDHRPRPDRQSVGLDGGPEFCHPPGYSGAVSLCGLSPAHSFFFRQNGRGPGQGDR